MTFKEYVLFIYIALILVFSIIAIIAYLVDKNKAIKGKMRTKEKASRQRKA